MTVHHPEHLPRLRPPGGSPRPVVWAAAGRCGQNQRPGGQRHPSERSPWGRRLCQDPPGKSWHWTPGPASLPRSGRAGQAHCSACLWNGKHKTHLRQVGSEGWARWTGRHVGRGPREALGPTAQPSVVGPSTVRRASADCSHNVEGARELGAAPRPCPGTPALTAQEPPAGQGLPYAGMGLGAGHSDRCPHTSPALTFLIFKFFGNFRLKRIAKIV